MKMMDSLAEMERVLPAEICRATRALLEGLEDFFDGASIELVSLTQLLGGPAYLVERVEDLAAVRSFDDGSDGRLSLLDGTSGAFDIAEWIACGSFARFVAIDSAEGGAQFFVPRYIANVAPNVIASIDAFEASLGQS